MPITGELKTIEDGGGKKDTFVLTFTNSALEQLQQLKDYFGLKDISDVITIGVSFLQRAKENEEKTKQEGQIKTNG